VIRKLFIRPLLVAAVVTALLAANGSLVLAQPVATITLPAPGAAKQLYPGCNNISLSFPDGTPSATVLQAVTPAGAVDTMWRHSAAQNRFEGYSAQYPQASDLLTVNFMDAVWLCMVEGLAAVQPPPAIVLPPPVLQVCNPPTVAAFAANPSTITAGQATTLSWGAVTDADTLTIDQGIGQVSGPVLVSPLVDTTYTLTATGCGGTATYQTTVTVNPAPGATANLEPTDLWIDWSTAGHPVMLTITNQYSENRSDFTIGGSCTMERYEPKGQTNQAPQATQTNDLGQIAVTVGWGQTTNINTGFSSFDLVKYTYIVYCTITPVDFTDDFWNSYLEQMD
jgi:hypothetical protein